MRSILLLAFPLLLSGCFFIPEPVPGSYHGPLAIVSDSSTSVSSTKIQFFELTRVDGRSVRSSSAATASKNYGQGLKMTPKLETREIPATICTLHIRGITHVAADILAFGGGLYGVEGDVTVKLSPKGYVVHGVLSKDYSAVWLEDELGRVVSKKIEKGADLYGGQRVKP